VVAYREYRSYLLATSQVGGGYYDAAARAGLLRRVIPMMLAERDPYDEFDRPIAEPGAYPRLVAGGTVTDRT
jgi:capsular polysaccharide export protein